MAKEIVLKRCLYGEHTAFVLISWISEETLVKLVKTMEVCSTP